MCGYLDLAYVYCWVTDSWIPNEPVLTHLRTGLWILVALGRVP